MLEDSVEGFVARFRAAAATVAIVPRVEGDPLLECVISDRSVHVFERTGPYLTRSGPASVILHLECDAVEAMQPDGAFTPTFEVLGVSRLEVDGIVRERDGPFLVVDAGVPLVVGLTAALPEVAVGDRVRLTSRPPVHGFVLPTAPPRDQVSPDELV